MQTGVFWEYVLLPPAGPADWKGLEQRFPEFAVEDSHCCALC